MFCWMSFSRSVLARYLSPGLKGGPFGCLKRTAVSMTHGCRSFIALRSDSSEWPMRMVREVIRLSRRYFWTSARESVAWERASAVIPDHLGGSA